MFYSPTKQFVRFSTYRTAQIKALKQRIQKEKVTPQEITATQMRLEKLKSQYELLQTENHGQLKEVLQNSQVAIAELLKQKSLKEADIKQKALQIKQLQSIKQQLQQKGSLIQEKLRSQIQQKESVGDEKVKNDQTILLLDKQFNSVTRELNKTRDAQTQIKDDENDLNKKWNTHRTQLEQCRKEKEELKLRIFQEKQKIARQQKEWELCQKEIQNHQALKEKQKVIEQLLKLKISNICADKVRSAQTELMLSQERQTQSGLVDLVNSIIEETSKLQKEQVSCQREIRGVLIKLSEEEAAKYKLEEKIAVAKSSLKLLKQKNQNLKNKMNSIFKNDSQLIKTISNKKVYPNCKPQVIDIVKKSAVQPLVSKENIVLPLSKGEKIQMVTSPRAFNEVSNRLV